MADAAETVDRLAAAEFVDIGGQQVALHFGDPDHEYAEAYAQAIVVDRSHEGRVRARGRDRINLLHRMSTNDLADLAAGQCRQTVLTTALARMVDVIWVLALPEQAVLITSPGREQAVRRWLSGYIFFQDDVQLTAAGEELAQFAIFGPRAGTVAESLCEGAVSLELDRLMIRDSLIVARGRGLAGDGFWILAPRDRAAEVWQQAQSAGAVPAGEATFQTLRVEHGQPHVDHEISEHTIPLEAGLWPAVSFGKGCYIGQEIIARMESRGRLAKTLVGLRLAGPVAEGAEVRSGESAAGRVSSVAVSPHLGHVALAFVRPAVSEPSTRLDVEGVEAEVSGLPMR